MVQRLRWVWQLAYENMEGAQQCQKASYVQKAQEREFQIGDKVLVLLPTSANKLLTKWLGLFEITRKVGPIDYDIHRPRHVREHQIYHVNVSKAWRELEG